jgi:hypothetical protein
MCPVHEQVPREDTGPRGRKEEEAGERFIRRRFVILTECSLVITVSRSRSAGNVACMGEDT